MALVRLQLGLKEQDLASKFDAPQSTLSKKTCTLDSAKHGQPLNVDILLRTNLFCTLHELYYFG